METAVLGAYEEDPYDQHNHLQSSFNVGLGESISFGRFAMDSFSWVKRSSFNHNQYLEELGNCSAPGSVREKKAYFEAYYKAKREALEKSLADEKAATDNNGMGVDGEEQKGNLCVDISSAEKSGTSSILKAEDDQLEEDGPNESIITDDGEADNLNLEHSMGHTFDNHEHSLHGAFSNSSYPVSMIENVDGEKVFVSEEENLEKLEDECREHIMQSGTESSEVIDVIEDLITLSEPIPGDYIDENGDDGHDGRIVDLHEEEISNDSHVKKSLTPLKAGRACVERPSHTRTSKRNTVQKNIGNGMSNATSRRNKSSMERRQGPGGFTLEAKNNLGTANARMNVTVTVPQSFKLATSKRTGMVSNPSDEEGTLSRKTIHNTAPLSCSSPLKRTRVPVTKTSMSKLFVDENNRQKFKAEQRTMPSMLQGVTKVKETDDEKEGNEPASTAPSLTSIKSSSNAAKIAVSSFSFKSDERAEKRREFNIKREAKLNEKQAEKNHAVAKTQEQEEEEAKVRQLRKSLKFRATPMPNFHQGTTEGKLETRKPGIPTTHAKSPKLGRKNVLNLSQETNSSTTSSKQEKETKTRKQDAEMLFQPSRNSSGVPKKTTKRLVNNGSLRRPQSSEQGLKETLVGSAKIKNHNRLECDENPKMEPVPTIPKEKCTHIEQELVNEKASCLTDGKYDNAKLDLVRDKAFSVLENGLTTLMEKEIEHESDPISLESKVEIGPDGSATLIEAESEPSKKTDGSSKEDTQAKTGNKLLAKDYGSSGPSPARRPPSPGIDRKWLGASPARRPPSPTLDRKRIGTSLGLDLTRDRTSTALTTCSPSLDPKGIRASSSRAGPSPSRDRMWVGTSPARRAPSSSIDPKWVGASSVRRAI